MIKTRGFNGSLLPWLLVKRNLYFQNLPTLVIVEIQFPPVYRNSKTLKNSLMLRVRLNKTEPPFWDFLWRQPLFKGFKALTRNNSLKRPWVLVEPQGLAWEQAIKLSFLSEKWRDPREKRASEPLGVGRTALSRAARAWFHIIPEIECFLAWYQVWNLCPTVFLLG